MAWIEVIDEDDATGDLNEVYEEIIDARGKLSNIMRVHSLNPEADVQSHNEWALLPTVG